MVALMAFDSSEDMKDQIKTQLFEQYARASTGYV